MNKEDVDIEIVYEGQLPKWLKAKKWPYLAKKAFISQIKSFSF